MHVLVKGLPPEALIRIPADERGRGHEPWTAYHELLAQLVEVTSIGAAEHRLKKPIKVNRPDRTRQHAQAAPIRVASARDIPGAAANPYRAAIAALGGAQPSSKRAQLAAGAETGMGTA